MERIPEPELMDEPAQARAYATADFEQPHSRFIELFRERFPEREGAGGWVLDLGCGPGDITLRFARAYPGCELHGVDGAPAMLELGRETVTAAGLDHRIKLLQGYLPGAALPRQHYDTVISNSLLHHLSNPMVLWESVIAYGRPGSAVFVMDLMRPDDLHSAYAMVDEYAAGEPEVLRHDFFHSLLAAYRLDEVEGQIRKLQLPLQVRAVSDRHFTVSGYL